MTVPREAREAVAEALLEYVIALASERGVPILTTRGRALSWTVESESEFIRRHREQPNAVCLVAVSGEWIIGTIDMMGGDRVETAHSVTLGMSVAKDWRDRGVGRALVTHALEWARETDGVSRNRARSLPPITRERFTCTRAWASSARAGVAEHLSRKEWRSTHW